MIHRTRRLVIVLMLPARRVLLMFPFLLLLAGVPVPVPPSLPTAV